MEKRIKLDELRYIRYRDSLPENLVDRVKRIYPIVSEIFPWSLGEWIDGFNYDLYPEKEIEIWEKLAEKFKFRCKIGGAKTKEEKKRVFQEIFEKTGAGNIEIGENIPSA